MSFIKTLATLAVGFAAARGVDRFQKMGGAAGMQDALRGAGQPGGMADQMGAMAEKLGIPGGRQAVADMMGRFGATTTTATDQAQSGLNGLLTAMTGAASAGARNMGDMMGALAGATPAGPIAEENARLMIRAMIQGAKADGGIDAEERRKIMDHLGDATPEEMAFVEAELAAPLDIAGLAAAVGETARAQVYSAALMAIKADTEAERGFLSTLAGALQLDAGTVATIHRSMGKPLV